MDARLLDVLQDAAHHRALAVAEEIEVDLDGVLEEAVEQHRMAGRHFGGVVHVADQRRLVVADPHGAPAQHVARPHHHRVADRLRRRARFGQRSGRAVLGLADALFAQQRAEAAAILGQVDGVGRRPQDAHARGLEPVRQLERRLAAELHHDADRLLALDHRRARARA